MLNPFKKQKSESVYSPVAGRIVSLDEVPDPVFAQRSVGDGFAVEPREGSFRSPVDGELVLVAKTLHAFAVRTPEGAEILVHIGIDTVTLKGAGFTGHRQAGETVSPACRCPVNPSPLRVTVSIPICTRISAPSGVRTAKACPVVATRTSSPSTGLRNAPSVGMTANPSPTERFAKTGSGTSSSETIRPATGL